MPDRGQRDRMVLVGAHAAWYDRLTTRVASLLYRAAAGQVLDELARGGRLLDVGTGPGQLLVEVARRRTDVTGAGIDPSADMIGHARRRLAAAAADDRFDLQIAGAEDLPFADASFDAVVSTLSSHHWADPAAAVGEQARVLRPGGQLWVFDLRGVAPSAVARELTARFPAGAVSRPRVHGPASVLIRCHRAG
ncbi:MAG: class I SAM-dependent methyltransferase [Frankiales bacterium]|nr:class I SAM-dependent methyltransferase [Frankiales bacterium]